VVKTRWSNGIGAAVAFDVCDSLASACVKCVVAGSLRRMKPTIGDVEILYIGKTVRQRDPADLFKVIEVNLADDAIAALENARILDRRTNVKGSEMYGAKNKLLRHRVTGMPVDLFAATAANWWNYLVCRTGPKESNMRIAKAAQAKGWKWNPYGVGFTALDSGEVRAMNSEKEVFEFVGMEYVLPEQRK